MLYRSKNVMSVFFWRLAWNYRPADDLKLTILTCRFQPHSYVSVMMKVSGCKRGQKFVELVKGELGPTCYVIWIVMKVSGCKRYHKFVELV